ncbi:DUF2294 domain-containing protein [Chlorogloeopsis fritschii PCC 9212]|uniref:Na+-translocating membrane potential-generating system MpsC domain-containing protein n=1 Tax=Chlorogloeopsis fritschii PCC 6912 TaxID=211165 RepID=A0A433MYN8_CHLFR|nr:Na-translocating system protein MpsC family protein [Chlorogloeopsis fritschii]MBF2009282.1 DUF2294 domain-containing protein [Chlorogloeopsis fritschii C42_A2020_084]RUR73491.1 hypothetical protein PCC6912_56620 [Chlorogloeopsis fritschii PCC 6912]
MTTSLPTRGQIERTLAQRIQALYREQLGHQPSKVSCQLAEQNLIILIEDSITPPEQLLAQTGRQELAEKVRSDLDTAIQPQLKELIEETLNIAVVEILSDATLETGRTGMIAILAETPSYRSSAAVTKARRKAS